MPSKLLHYYVTVNVINYEMRNFYQRNVLLKKLNQAFYGKTTFFRFFLNFLLNFGALSVKGFGDPLQGYPLYLFLPALKKAQQKKDAASIP
jgi:hypothetical protein